MPSVQAYRARSQGEGKDLRVELDIYDVVGADPFFGGGIAAKQVLDTVRPAGEGSEILCRINSAGGIVTEGLAIYNLLTQKAAEGVRVTCRVDSLAGSIASVIAMAGRLEMAEHSFLMIHNPFGFVEGDAQELRNQAAVLEQMREQMLDIYANKAGLKKRDAIARMLDAETWLAPVEALAIGLCDEIIADPKVKLAAQVDLARFKRAPAEARAAFAARADELAETQPDKTALPAPAAEPANTGEAAMAMTEEEEKKMKDLEEEVAALKSKLAESEKEDEEPKDEEDDEDKAKAESDEEPKDEDDKEEKEATAAIVQACVALTGVKDLRRLEGAVMALGPRLQGYSNAKAARSLQVSRLIAKGKLLPAQKKWAMSCSNEALEQYLESLGDAKVGPVGEELSPDDEAAPVGAARASVQVPKFDPESVQLSADEEKIVKQMGATNPRLRAELLADKRARAEAAHKAKYGSRSAA